MFPKTAISIHLRWLFYFPKHANPVRSLIARNSGEPGKTSYYKEPARCDLVLRERRRTLNDYLLFPGTHTSLVRSLFTGNSNKPGTISYYEELILRGTYANPVRPLITRNSYYEELTQTRKDDLCAPDRRRATNARHKEQVEGILAPTRF
jgi:hypothetical protein